MKVASWGTSMSHLLRLEGLQIQRRGAFLVLNGTSMPIREGQAGSVSLDLVILHFFLLFFLRFLRIFFRFVAGNCFTFPAS